MEKRNYCPHLAQSFLAFTLLHLSPALSVHGWMLEPEAGTDNLFIVSHERAGSARCLSATFSVVVGALLYILRTLLLMVL